MSDFYIVPPRLIVGSLDRSNVVTSVNTLRGDLSFRVNPDTGLVLNINSGTFNFSIAPDFYIKKSGDIVNSNIIFQPNYGNYGLAVGSGSSDPIAGVPGALFFRTDIDVLKVYDGSTWNEIASTGTSGITATFADGRYLRLDGGNVPTAAISMGSQFLRFANLTTRSIAGTAGQVYFNTDTNKLDLYDGSNWTAVGSGITSLTPGIGITLSSNPITSFGSIGVDQSYNFNWTGTHTFSNPITFAANQQFDASKLTIAYEVAGDLLTYNGANWSRLAKGTANQILAVDACGGAVNYRTLEAGAGIAISPTPNSIVISATGASGFSPGGGSAIGLSSLNGLGTTDQFLVIGYSGYGPNIVSSGSTHTFNIPFAGIGTSGLVTGLAQTFGGVKTFEEILLGLPLNSKYGGTGYTNYNLGDLLVGAGSSFVILPKAPSSRYVLSTNSNTASGLAWTTNAGVFITSLAPTVVEAYTGDLWYNSSNGSFNILYTDEDTTQWVEIVGGNVQEILSGVSYGIPYYVPGTTTITSDNNFLNNGSSIFIGYGTGSTTPTTGALTVIGGVGISGDTNVGGVVTVSETVNVSSGGFSDLIGGFAPLSTGFRQLNVGDPVGTLVNYGGFANVGNAFIGGTTTITDTSASLSTRSGALVVFGGVGIGGSIFQSSTKASSISGVVLDNGSVRYASWAGNAITAFYGGTGYTNYTKGDILVGAGSTFIILQPGSNDQVLTVDNTASSGYKWSTVTATGGGGSAIGISTINGIGVTDQFIAFGYSGTEPNIVSSGSTHTINIPLAGNGITGLVSSTGTQYFSGVKIFTNNVGVNGTVVATTLDADTLIVDQASIGSSFQVLGDLVVGTATTGSLYFQRAYMGSIDSVEWPYISFIGTTNRPMTLNVLNDGTLAFNGTYGQLFSIQENSIDSGWIHKISDISGMPILRVHSDGVVALGEYGGSVGIGKSDPSYKLDVVGDINLSAGSNYYIDGVPISAGAGGSGIVQINGLDSTIQFLTTGTSGLDFNISSTGRTHIFNLPDASTTARGLVNTSSQTFVGQKTFTSAIVGNLTGSATTSQNVNISSALSDATHPLVFTPSLGTSSGTALSSSSTLSYNPNNNILSSSGISVTASTVSTSSSSGALIVSGGVGIGGSLYTSTSSADSISGVVLSNGVVTTGTWAGNLITTYYGGTGYSTYTKGDLLVGVGSTFIKLPVGTDNYVLAADNTSASGLKWVLNSGGGGGGTGTSVYIGESPPPYSSTAGDLWYNSDNGGLNIYYVDVDTAQWVEINSFFGGVDAPANIGLGITQINGLGASAQFLYAAIGGSSVSVISAGNGHTVYIPLAGSAITGLVSGFAQTFGGVKTFQDGLISGNGLTVYGSLTLPNQPLSAIYGGTGKTSYSVGDLLVGVGSSIVPLSVGTNGYVLQSNSSSPSGVGWTYLSSVTVSETIPSPAATGDLWWNSFDGSLNVYFVDIDSTPQWVEVGNGPSQGSSGTTSVISASYFLASYGYLETVYDYGTSSGSITPNWNNGSTQKIVLNGGLTLNVPTNMQSGSTLKFIIRQDSSGNHTLSANPSLKFKGGNKTLSTSVNAIDMVKIYYDGTNYLCDLDLAYS